MSVGLVVLCYTTLKPRCGVNDRAYTTQHNTSSFIHINNNTTNRVGFGSPRILRSFTAHAKMCVTQICFLASLSARYAAESAAGWCWWCWCGASCFISYASHDFLSFSANSLSLSAVIFGTQGNQTGMVACSESSVRTRSGRHDSCLTTIYELRMCFSLWIPFSLLWCRTIPSKRKLCALHSAKTNTAIYKFIHTQIPHGMCAFIWAISYIRCSDVIMLHNAHTHTYTHQQSPYMWVTQLLPNSLRCSSAGPQPTERQRVGKGWKSNRQSETRHTSRTKQHHQLEQPTQNAFTTQECDSDLLHILVVFFVGAIYALLFPLTNIG